MEQRQARYQKGKRLAALLLAALALAVAPPLRVARAEVETGEGAAGEAPDGAEGAGEEDPPFEMRPALTEDDFREELDALSGQLAQLKEQQEAVKGQIAGAKSAREKKLLEKTSWESQIQSTKDQITLLEERIALLEGEIAAKQEEIGLKQRDIDDNYEKYKQRMRASFMEGQSSTLAMVLGANSFTDFLMRAEMVSSIAAHDKALLERLRGDRAALDEAKAALSAAKAQVEGDRADMQARKAQLETELAATKSEIQDIDLMEQEYLARKAELDAMDKKVQAEINKIFAKIDNSTEYVGGEFSWPLPGYSTITSYYGLRFGNTNFHTGIDISGSGIYGESIRAANNGKVAFVQATYSDGVGYGKYAIVDHGGGYATLYAHMSSISVREGDYVTRGVTEIGKVGSTGWSTGPHLHFEVRINGSHKDPLPYLKG